MYTWKKVKNKTLSSPILVFLQPSFLFLDDLLHRSYATVIPKGALNFFLCPHLLPVVFKAEYRTQSDSSPKSFTLTARLVWIRAHQLETVGCIWVERCFVFAWFLLCVALFQLCFNEIKAFIGEVCGSPTQHRAPNTHLKVQTTWRQTKNKRKKKITHTHSHTHTLVWMWTIDLF